MNRGESKFEARRGELDSEIDLEPQHLVYFVKSLTCVFECKIYKPKVDLLLTPEKFEGLQVDDFVEIKAGKSKFVIKIQKDFLKKPGNIDISISKNL